MPRLYAVQVDIYEAASRYAYPVVRHVFLGRTREEAWGYYRSHMKSDAFLRACRTQGEFEGRVTCKTVVREGWES